MMYKSNKIHYKMSRFIYQNRKIIDFNHDESYIQYAPFICECRMKLK